MAKVFIPVGEDSNLEPTLTPEQIEAKRLSDEAEVARIAAETEAARLLAEKDKTPPAKTHEELAAEEAARIEAARIEAEKNVKPTIIVEDAEGNEVTYFLNDKGDATDKDGKVIHTAEQIASYDTPEVDLVAQVSALSGIQVLGEDGKPKVYASTAEGIAQRESDIRKLGYQEAQQTALKNYFETNQDVASMAEYKRVHGTLDGYASHVDYSKVVIDPNNVEQQYDLIYKAELKRGNSPERAKRLADFAKADNTLLADSQESKTYLETLQTAESTAATARDLAIANEAIKQENEYFGIAYNDQGKEVVLNVEGSIYDIIVNKGDIGGLKIPIDGVTVKGVDGTSKIYTRRQIFDYVSTPVKEVNGEYYTQAQIDEYTRISKKEELVSTYIRNLFGGDLSSLVSTAKLQDKADNVRRIKIGDKSTPKSSSGGSNKVIIPIR